MKLTLSIVVEFEPNGVPVSELHWMLMEIANRAASEGLFTGDTAAAVVSWGAQVDPPVGPCQHEPNMSSLTLEQESGDDVYVDVNCKHCGQLGCIAKIDRTTEVDW